MQEKEENEKFILNDDSNENSDEINELESEIKKDLFQNNTISSNKKEDENTKLILKLNKEISRSLFEIDNDIENKDINKEGLDKLYDDIDNDDENFTKYQINHKTNKKLLYFSYFILGPLFSIFFLTGIFQLKSLYNVLLDLIKESSSTSFTCYFGSNCNITLIEGERNVFDFYNYYYESTTNETINFNLMMITSTLGNSLVKFKGFTITAFILCLFNFGSMIWLLNFNFNLENLNEFNYSLLEILNLVIILILFLIGLGGSSLLSQRILIESHLIFKKFKDETKTTKLKKSLELEDKTKSENFTIKDSYLDGKTKDKKKEKNENRKNNILDFFITTCLTTIIGYLGKYSTNLAVDKILVHIYDEFYDKKLFLYGIMILYGISLLISMIIYQIFKLTVFESKEEDKKKKEIKFSKICGYIIYSETKILDNDQINNSQVYNIQENYHNTKSKRNCCILFFESFQNCCNDTFCHILSTILSKLTGQKNIDDSCKCVCRCCKYDENDYEKNEEVFHYCYKAKRKSYWCNKFFTNSTTKTFFPYMIFYCILQLSTIGFEKQYEKYKNIKQNEHKKTYYTIYISTFILFLYLTISFCYLFKKEKKNIIILDGTYGVLYFNCIFSIIFSSLYIYHENESIKDYFFTDNINIIFMPILMNKFYYFSLNYYCTYSSEKEKKSEILSSSTVISLYIIIWNLILSTLIKILIPDEKKNNGYSYYNVLYIIQIVISSIPCLLVGLFIVGGLIYSLWCIKGRNCCFYEFFCCLFCYFFCLGGLWFRLIFSFEEKEKAKYELECCNCGDYCEVDDECCIVYCHDNNLVFGCCCCDENSCCKNNYCKDHCNDINIGRFFCFTDKISFK